MTRYFLFLMVGLIMLSCYSNKQLAERQSSTKKQSKDIVTEGLLAYYKLNKNADDASGNNNHGQMVGGLKPTTDRFGNPCAAMAFNGTDAYITVANSQSLASPIQAVSIAGWFRIDADSPFANLKWVTMVCKSSLRQEERNSPQYRLQLTSQTLSLNTDFTENVRHPFAYGQWHFYAMTYNGQNVLGYLDGKLVFQYTYVKPLVPNFYPLEIGRDLPGKVEYFGGALDDIRIYNRALSASEITRLFADLSGKSVNVDCGTKSIVKQPVVPDTGGQLDFQHTVEVNNKEITVYIYDHAKPDGDIVSVNVNGQWYADKHKLKRKNRKHLDKTMHFKVNLLPNQDNVLFAKAWNLGKNPPNTLTVEIHDGFNKPQYLVLNSEIGKSGAVRIRCVL